MLREHPGVAQALALVQAESRPSRSSSRTSWHARRGPTMLRHTRDAPTPDEREGVGRRAAAGVHGAGDGRRARARCRSARTARSIARRCRIRRDLAPRRVAIRRAAHADRRGDRRHLDGRAEEGRGQRHRRLHRAGRTLAPRDPRARQVEPRSSACGCRCARCSTRRRSRSSPRSWTSSSSSRPSPRSPRATRSVTPADALAERRAELERRLAALSPEKRAQLERARASGEPAVRGAAGSCRATAGAPVPMSYAQELLWLLDRANPGMHGYNVPRTARLRGPLDVAALQRRAGRQSSRATRCCARRSTWSTASRGRSCTRRRRSRSRSPISPTARRRA